MKRLSLMLLALLIGCSNEPERTVMVCTGNACAEQDRKTVTYDAAAAAPNRDPDGRVAALEALAKDDPSAAYDLSLRLFRADGVPQDSYKALQWMRSAAERGDARAQLALGRLYVTGLQEMGQDLREAEVWLAAAAGKGDKEAQTLLAEVQRTRADDNAFRRRIAEWRAATQYYWGSGWGYRWGWRNYAWYPLYGY